MTLYKQAICFICTHDIRTESLDDVKILWGDEDYTGRPICWGCFCDLKSYCPEKLIAPGERKKSECNEKCFECSYLLKKLNGNYHCYSKHVNMGKNVYYNNIPIKIGIEQWL